MAVRLAQQAADRLVTGRWRANVVRCRRMLLVGIGWALVLATPMVWSQTPEAASNGTGAAAANGSLLFPAKRHPWGAFPVGSWKRVRVVTETLDGKGRVLSTSTTETTSTLESVGDREFSLRVESAVEISGKRFPSQPQTLRQGFYGEASGQVATARKSANSQLTINGLVIPCETREVSVQGDAKRRLTVMQLSDKYPPYVLESITTMIGADGKTPVVRTSVEAVALNMPFKVLAETKSTSFVKTTHIRDDGRTITTLEIQSPDVPGAVVAHTSKETDAQGQLLQRSTLELLDFGTEDNQLPVRRRLFQRSHNKRSAKEAASGNGANGGTNGGSGASNGGKPEPGRP